MALLIRGHTTCPICGKPIKEGDETVAFPPLISNRKDPLFLFSDAVFHRSCFSGHPFAGRVESLSREMLAKSGPKQRLCVVCSRDISSPDDYLTTGALASSPDDPLFPYNFSQLHRSCIRKWTDRDKILDLLHELEKSGNWEGPTIRWLIAELHNTATSPHRGGGKKGTQLFDPSRSSPPASIWLILYWSNEFCAAEIGEIEMNARPRQRPGKQ